MGVQGINPDTGELDVTTPTESRHSSGGEGALQRIHAIRKVLSDAKDSYRDVTAWTDREMKSILLDKNGRSHISRSRQTKDLKAIAKGVQWRRQTKQWASVGHKIMGSSVSSGATDAGKNINFVFFSLHS